MSMIAKLPVRLLRIITVLPLVLLLWTCSSTSGGVRERATDLGVPLTDQDIELVNSVMSRVVSNALVDKSSTHLIDDALIKIRDAEDIPADRTRVDVGLNAALKDLDPYAVYLNADRTRRMRERLSGNFEGIGVFIGIRDEKLTVTSPIEGSPAMAAGLQPQDHITHVNGTPTQGLSVGEAAALMRGRRGTDVAITIQRKNESPFDVSITRALITVPTASSRRYGDIGYLRLTQFTETTESGLEEAVNKLVLGPAGIPSGFILDLRNNPGGLTTQATAVADAFMETGLIWSTSRRGGQETRRYSATSGDITLGRPLVVLQNRGSASASEIVAGGLQGNGRAVVLGTRSFGKGVAQSHFRLGSNGTLRLTTLQFYKPDGTSAHKVGIQPDILVTQPEDDTEVTDESKPRLGEADGSSCPEVDAVEADDFQLRCAIALLRAGGTPAFMALHRAGS